MAKVRRDFSVPQDVPEERRSGERITSVYRPILIETDEFAGFCLLRNLSPGGMMGSVYAQLAERQPITVEFRFDHVMTGEIAWCSEGRIGIEFDQPIDVEHTLQLLSEPAAGSRINRSPRLSIACEGVIELKGWKIPIRLRDISQRGIKLEAAHLKLGEEVIVHLEGLEPHKAVVRWTQGGLAGLNFLRPIPFEELAGWVIERQSQ